MYNKVLSFLVFEILIFIWRRKKRELIEKIYYSTLDDNSTNVYSIFIIKFVHKVWLDIFGSEYLSTSTFTSLNYFLKSRYKCYTNFTNHGTMTRTNYSPHPFVRVTFYTIDLYFPSVNFTEMRNYSDIFIHS